MVSIYFTHRIRGLNTHDWLFDLFIPLLTTNEFAFPSTLYLYSYFLCRLKTHNRLGWGEVATLDPLIFTMDHPDFIVCSFMEITIGPKRVNR